MRLLALGVVALGAGAIATGCGGDDESTSTHTAPIAPLSTDEFIDYANRICTEEGGLIERAGRKLSRRPSQAEGRRFVVGTVLPHIQLITDRLRTLPPPAGDEAKVNAILDANQRGIDELRRTPDLRRADAVLSGGRGLARRYGLKTCAQPSGANGRWAR